MSDTGTNLLDASRELLNRPGDEHFPDFRSLRAAARTDQQNSRTVDVAPRDLTVVPHGSTLRVQRRGGEHAYPLSFDGGRALCRLAGASPDFVFGRLSPETASLALTEGLDRSPARDDKVRLLVGTVSKADGTTSAPVLRAVTSTGYCRTWDADVLDEVDRWLVPHGFAPALPTKNTDAQRNNIHGNNKPALFRGGADSFAFFMAEGEPGGGTDGGRPVRRGVMLRNSEVGRAALEPTRMLFDDLCANFIIWGARAVKSLRIIHRGRDDRDLLRRFRTMLREVEPTVAAAELALLDKAAATAFASTTEVAAERLVKQFGLTQGNATAAMERATWAENRGTKPLSHAWVANGVTSLAKETAWADSLAELATIGGDIYAAAGAA